MTEIDIAKLGRKALQDLYDQRDAYIRLWFKENVGVETDEEISSIAHLYVFETTPIEMVGENGEPVDIPYSGMKVTYTQSMRIRAKTEEELKDEVKAMAEALGITLEEE